MKQNLDDLLERANIEGWMPERIRKELLNLEHDTRMRLNNARNSHH